jgi:hypothetical protein
MEELMTAHLNALEQRRSSRAATECAAATRDFVAAALEKLALQQCPACSQKDRWIRSQTPRFAVAVREGSDEMLFRRNRA